jgi:hypothetical protein
MPNRWLLIAVLILVAIVAAVYYVPQWLHTQRFRQACTAMLEHAAAGEPARALNYIEPASRQQLSNYFSLLPAGYADDIQRLRLTGWQATGRDAMMADVVLKLATTSGLPLIYELKLAWRYDRQAGQWLCDPQASSVAQFSTSGPADWQPLGDFIRDHARL